MQIKEAHVITFNLYLAHSEPVFWCWGAWPLSGAAGQAVGRAVGRWPVGSAGSTLTCHTRSGRAKHSQAACCGLGKFSVPGEHCWGFKSQRKGIKAAGRRCFCGRYLHSSSALIALIDVWLQWEQKDRDKWTSCRKNDPCWSCLVGRDRESTKVKSLMTSILNDCSSCIPSG